MPFTFSHPAIVLPLTFLPRQWFSLTGLVIGSLIPDFEYFLRMRIKSTYSHTIDGLFWFDLPLGLLLAFIFHNTVRNRLYDNLPTFLKSRFLTFKQFNWNRYFKRNCFVVAISILIGATSHIFLGWFYTRPRLFRSGNSAIAKRSEPIRRTNSNLKNIATQLHVARRTCNCFCYLQTANKQD